MTHVVSRTPFRVSFFGGGTDYPAWYRREGGAVLSTAVDKYCYISCRYLPPFFPDAYRVVWAHIETVSSISEILHPAVREGLRMLEFEGGRGVEVIYQGDLPARTGMGSSSAFAVGLIHALSALHGARPDKPTLYRRAIELEQDWLQDSVGSQDQVAAAVGGMNVIRFGTDGGIDVEPLALPPARFEALRDRLMMFYTGRTRLASNLAAQVVRNMDQRTAHLRRMRAMVDQAAGILTGDGDLDDFGRMLDETWRLKRELSEGIANETIDDIYARGLAAGALGGKLLGAGSSGFMLFHVPPDRHEAVCQALSDLMAVPFGLDTQGSTLLYNAADDGR
ncbi:kinase [Roseospira visakhapatnamensis]|uniref:D-glycero-alpha-D-manno-heptose-7-phosphate kinase n=1 Tax=Roseospira visakhapatnamensis TaxID=390880 RepID=A0A7W6RFH9_9PROT|nr:kinase [Roseospira visakhapatnamensis]MBB4267472.1 D-glycero-alpha-D-manno-heptose-7-phosphate kinase [Roseospira visakhapatnamensis]